MKRTVFFGPFVGEFGWEFLYWQGWVRKMCLGPFRDFHKIACSFPGRQPFYPLVDEFLPLPQAFLDFKPSGHSYITDGWRDGYPGRQHEMQAEIDPRTGGTQFTFREEPLQGPNMGDICELMLTQFRSHFRPDTRFFVPWKWIQCPEDNLEFGTKLAAGEKIVSRAPIFFPPNFDQQKIVHLECSAQAAGILQKAVPEPRKLVCVFPRQRLIRRPDKNWTKQNYQTLIEKFQSAWPDVTVVICGEPGGAYFSDGVPAGCIDLINVPAENRLDLQIAALKRSVLSVGAVSGAICIALGAGCPSIVFCCDYYVDGWNKANVLKTELVLHPDMNPTVETIFALADQMRCRHEGKQPETSSQTANNPISLPPEIPVQRISQADRSEDFDALYSRIKSTLLEGIDAKTVASCEIAFADPDICWLLYSTIRRKKPRSVIETGCFMGMSTLVCAGALAANAREGNPSGKIYTISLDSFYRIENPMSHAATNAQRLGLAPYIHFLEGSSIPFIAMEAGDSEIARKREEYLRALLQEGRESLLPRLASLLGSIDLVYLDSLHYEGVQMTELAAVLEHLAPAGEVIVDDVCFRDYPNAWIIEAFARTDLARVTKFESNGKQLRAIRLEKNPSYRSFYKRFSSWWWPGTLQEFIRRFELSPYGRGTEEGLRGVPSVITQEPGGSRAL